MRQNDKLLINLLYKPRAGNDVEKLLKVRFIHESDENYIKKCLEHICRIWARYEKEWSFLKGLRGEPYKREANDKIQITLNTQQHWFKLLRI